MNSFPPPDLVIFDCDGVLVDSETISNRLLSHLLYRKRGSLMDIDRECVLVAHNLLPSDIISMNREKIVGIATDFGGKTSHVAILARAFEIPAVLGTLPNLATSERPIPDAANAFMGPVGAAVIVIGALISILGNLNVGFLGASRITYAMGAGNEAPAILAATHERFRTPWVSLLLNAVVVFVLTVYASFLTAVAIATITRLLVYATTCASLLVFRRRTDLPRAPFLAPFGITASILSLILIFWLLTNVDFKKEGIPIIIAALVGLVLYGLSRLASKPHAAPPSESL